jgi:molybdopterin converting factor small subunit
MRVEVVAFPPYRAGLGAGRLDVDLAEGSTLRDLLRALGRRSDELGTYAGAQRDEWLWGQLLVHARGEIVRLDDPLHDGQCLELLPPISGGT